MTFVNNGFNEYRVVRHCSNHWNGAEWREDVFITNNLLEAYWHLKEEEKFLNALSYHDAGSPVKTIYKIDVYVNKDKT